MTVRCQDNASVGVTFRDRFSFDADSVHFAVKLRAPGLTARVDEVVAWIWDSDLTAFLEELATDYQEWDGERSWHTNDRDLTVSAAFRSGGYVGHPGLAAVAAGRRRLGRLGDHLAGGRRADDFPRGRCPGLPRRGAPVTSDMRNSARRAPSHREALPSCAYSGRITRVGARPVRRGRDESAGGRSGGRRAQRR
ncbi:hypothetical protein FBY35_7018 [Streptomyces sp. SLBN-118]|nr:hypothetical protein FBY35_7018 [Streptomyces sp. SLBN-118]